jgi:hypothetical protein
MTLKDLRRLAYRASILMNIDTKAYLERVTSQFTSQPDRKVCTRSPDSVVWTMLSAQHTMGAIKCSANAARSSASKSGLGQDLLPVDKLGERRTRRRVGSAAFDQLSHVLGSCSRAWVWHLHPTRAYHSGRHAHQTKSRQSLEVMSSSPVAITLADHPEVAGAQ